MSFGSNLLYTSNDHREQQVTFMSKILVPKLTDRVRNKTHFDTHLTKFWFINVEEVSFCVFLFSTIIEIKNNVELKNREVFYSLDLTVMTVTESKMGENDSLEMIIRNEFTNQRARRNGIPMGYW